jgi:adenine-specific DNA-methyltransferase
VKSDAYQVNIISKPLTFNKIHPRYYRGNQMPRGRKPKTATLPEVPTPEPIITDARPAGELKAPPTKATAIKTEDKKQIEQYEHKKEKRCNNPPIGLVRAETDPEGEKKTYQYDPHLDPQLQWAGKAEHTSFDVPTVSLHVHERIDPHTLINAVRKRNGAGERQVSLFEYAGENPPIREAIEFYKHRHNWSNRLIAGDSLLVMNSLLAKEGMAGKVQMIYIDPPYGIRYGSNFQPFVNKKNVVDGKDEDLTQEPEMVKAFRDTWELGIHSYLTYLQDRLLLARDLLNESGSIFIQISEDNIHHIREILDEVFGKDNFLSQIAYTTTSGLTTNTLSRAGDYIVWYAKERKKLKYRQLFSEKIDPLKDTKTKYDQIEFSDGTRRSLTPNEKNGITKLPIGSKIFRFDQIASQGSSGEPTPFIFEGKKYNPAPGRHWTANYPEGMENLRQAKRIGVSGNNLSYIRYFDDFRFEPIHNLWYDVGGSVQSRSDPKIYVVQTGTSAIQRCILMATDPGDLVLDPTCGSGTTAFVSEQCGRRWITCDTSRVAITLAKQRLMTSLFDYYELHDPVDGVSSGFRYKTAPHQTLKSIAYKEATRTETLYDKPIPDNSRVRVTGPFTVEAVPSPTVKPLTEIEVKIPADVSVARSGETIRQSEWRDELFRTGIRGKGGQKIEFTRVEPMSGARWLHAEAATSGPDPQKVVVSFGPEHAPLEPKQVELAIKEAERLVPKPSIVLFVAFQFDPEAAKNIDETKWKDVNLLKVQMNADLLTEDLKKKRVTNESFWLIGQPDVQVEKIKEGNDKGKYLVQVLGFDYYDTKNGSVISGGAHNIAVWMLDTDYDGRSLYPKQVFFPMADEKGGWSRLAKNLKAEIDQDLIEAYHGTTSLPFKLGTYNTIAVKIVDDRGIESIKIIEVD